MNPHARSRLGAAILVLLLAQLLQVASRAQSSAEWSPTMVPGEIPASNSEWGAFRSWVRVPDHWADPNGRDLYRDSVTFTVGHSDAAFELWINQTRIGAEGSFPPEPSDPGPGLARYKVPPGVLEMGRWNQVTLIVYHPDSQVGFPTKAPSIQGYFLECVLSGTWEFRPGPNTPVGPTLAERPERAGFDQFVEASRALEEANTLMPGTKLSPEESWRQLRVAEDLVIELVLEEPRIAQPTHISFDARGRLWVSEYRQYPYPSGLTMLSRDKYYRAQYDREPLPPPNHHPGRSRISIHEDRDRDGDYESTTIFLEGLDLANAALPTADGVWVMHTPYLLFYPDEDQDDVPDGAPEVHLAGFGFQDTHSVANGLRMGPDGWIYGAQGSTVASHIRRVHAADPRAEEPTVYYEGCMVWRYHPRDHEFEIFGHGGGNVFGLEFDDDGRLFSGHNGGDTRGWHYVQGAYLLKQGRSPNKFGPATAPYAFGDLPMMRSAHAIPRFSHALIVGAGAALPSRLQGRFIAADPLHHQVILSERSPRGATFETSDNGILLQSDDPRFRPVYMTNGPDGAIYIADFYEEFIAHGQHYQSQIDPSTGRIYRLRGKDSALTTDTDLTGIDATQLQAFLDHPNKELRQMALRLLGSQPAHRPLREALETRTLQDKGQAAPRGLWALSQMDRLTPEFLRQCLRHPYPPLRAWTVRLLGDRRSVDTETATALQQLATREDNLEVWSQLAATARHLTASQGLDLVRPLLARSNELEDPYLPLQLWWAIETHCDTARDRVLSLFEDDAIGTSSLVTGEILPRLARRLALRGREQDLVDCAQLIRGAPSIEGRRALMAGLEQAFEGGSLPHLPKTLLAAIADSEVASLVFRIRNEEPRAIAQAQGLAADPDAPLQERLTTIQALGEIQDNGPRETLLALLSRSQAPEIQRAALIAVRRFPDLEVATRILAHYSNLPSDEQTVAQATLVSRPEWAALVLDAIESGALQQSSVSAQAQAAMRRHDRPSLNRRIESLFPATPSNAPDRQARVRELVDQIGAAPGSPYRGRPLFLQRCASCHVLFHDGRAVGPELTSYQRDDLGSLLNAIVDPDFEIREGYEGVTLHLQDGRLQTGFIADRGSKVLTLRGFDGSRTSTPLDQVQRVVPLGRSLMPGGLIDDLTDQQRRDLIAYLRSDQPMLAD